MAFRTYSEPVAVDPTRVGYQESFVAEEDILQGQFVTTGGTNEDEVEPSATDGEFVYGIADHDAAAGATVLVHISGLRVRATSGSGGITAGDPVASHGSSGEEGELDTAASGDFVVGRAFEDDNGDGGDAIVYLNPQGATGGIVPK